MEPIFKVEMKYDENLFYHQVLASKKKASVMGKKSKLSFLEDIKFMDLIMGLVAFFIYYMATAGADMPERIGQSVFATFIFLFLMKQINRRKKSNNNENTTDVTDRRHAKANLADSGLEGESLEVRFGEDSFETESPGIVTEYQYEGIGWIKETAEFYMIFWNSTMMIPVAKDGFTEGRPEQFKAFLEKKCQKTVELVTVAVQN